VTTLHSWFENLSLLQNILSVTKTENIRKLGKENFPYFSASVTASGNI